MCKDGNPKVRHFPSLDRSDLFAIRIKPPLGGPSQRPGGMPPRTPLRAAKGRPHG